MSEVSRLSIARRLAIVAFMYDLQPDSPTIIKGRDAVTIDAIKTEYSLVVGQLCNAKFVALNDVKHVARILGQPKRCAGILKAHKLYDDARYRLMTTQGYVEN